jgi:hypothetical protein
VAVSDEGVFDAHGFGDLEVVERCPVPSSRNPYHSVRLANDPEPVTDAVCYPDSQYKLKRMRNRLHEHGVAESIPADLDAALSGKTRSVDFEFPQ